MRIQAKNRLFTDQIFTMYMYNNIHCDKKRHTIETQIITNQTSLNGTLQTTPNKHD